MQISSIEAIPFSLPLHKVHRWGAAGVMRAREHVLIRIRSDTGYEGVAEATPRPTIHGETIGSVLAVVDDYLKPSLLGRDPWDRAGYWTLMNHIPWNPTAKGGIDIAIHDLLSRSCDLPLTSFLGGAPRDVTIGYMVGLGSAESLLEEASSIKEQSGITSFKLKAGADPDVDVARVRELRSLLGEDAFIFVDPNELYDPATAVRTIRRMEEHGLAMVEEPVPRGLGQRRRRVAEQIGVPIVGDDSVASVAAARVEAEVGTIGIMGIKTPRTGMWGSIQIARLADAFGLPLWIGSQGVSGVGTLPSAHFAAAFGDDRIPADLGNYLKQRDDLLAEPLKVVDGRLVLPQAPGSGAVIDEEKLAAFRIDG